MATFYNLTINHTETSEDGKPETIQLDISLNFDNVLYITDATDYTFLITCINGKVLTVDSRIELNNQILEHLGVFRR